MPWAASELGLGPAPASLLPSRKVGREAAAALPANQAQPGGHSTASQTGYGPGLGPHVPTQGTYKAMPCTPWETLGPGGSPGQVWEPQGGPSHPAGHQSTCHLKEACGPARAPRLQAAPRGTDLFCAASPLSRWPPRPCCALLRPRRPRRRSRSSRSRVSEPCQLPQPLEEAKGSVRLCLA